MSTCSAHFSISGFQFLSGLSFDILAPAQIPVPGFQFEIPVWTLLRSHLSFLFLVSSQALVRLPSLSADPDFRFPVSVFRFRFGPGLLASRFPVAGFQLGSGPTGIFYKSATNPIWFAIVCLSVHILPQMLPHVAMRVDCWKLWHFCDDPVCPDPVWKLSTIWIYHGLTHNSVYLDSGGQQTSKRWQRDV